MPGPTPIQPRPQTRRDLETLEDVVQKENNGVQFTYCAYYHAGDHAWIWREPSEFVAIQHQQGNQVVLVRSDRDKKSLREQAMKFAEQKLKELTGKTEDENESRDIGENAAAVPYSRVQYAWRFVRGDTFVFFCGGVGAGKLNQFNDTISERSLMDEWVAALKDFSFRKQN